MFESLPIATLAVPKGNSASAVVVCVETDIAADMATSNLLMLPTA